MAFLLATSCDLHPDEIFTGFCPSCLRERLAGLDAASSLSSAPRRSTSALKSLFSILPSSSTTTAGAGPEASSSSAAPPHPITSSELRRCKSFSARPASSAAFVRSNSQVVREDPNAEMRPMKMHIDLESSQSNNRDQKASSSSSSTGNFWIKKWNSWRNKQKHKKQQEYTSATSKAAKAAMPPPPKIPNPSGRHNRPRRYCDTQSELGGGRRSCDTDPRFSVDAARISFDCPPRFSFDEPSRPSWDRPGYSRMHPTLSTVQDAPDPLIYRSDGQMPIEEAQGSLMPGSQAQTRDYYLDSSSRRRRSFERSISGRKSSQIDLSNSKVSPAGSSEFYQHNNHQHAIRDELSESFNSTAYRESEKKGKKWSLWGLINKKRNNERDQNANVVDRSFSEAWPELRGQLGRSNSTVSGRSSFSGSMRRNSVESSINGYSKNKRRDDFVLERNRNGRLNSPGQVDYNNINGSNGNNGMLRFYLGPTGGNQSGRRSNGIRPVNYSSNSQSFSSKRMY